jgi:hypothetical protein
METVLVLGPIDSDLATMTAGTAVATLPVANLQNVQPRKKWRSDSSTSETIDIVFADAVAADSLAAVGANFSASAQWRFIMAATADGLDDPPVDSGLQSVWPATGKPAVRYWPNYLSLLRWTNATACRFGRLTISDPSNADGYIEIGRLVVGQAWQPANNFDIGGTPLSYDPKDVVAETDYGYSFTDRRSRSAPRLFSLQFTAASHREILDGIAEIQRLAGLSGDVICCLDPAETTDFHRYSMQGRFTGPPQFTAPAAFDANGYTTGASIALKEFL